jgi:hypothetical protein
MRFPGIFMRSKLKSLEDAPVPSSMDDAGQATHKDVLQSIHEQLDALPKCLEGLDTSWDEQRVVLMKRLNEVWPLLCNEFQNYNLLLAKELLAQHDERIARGPGKAASKWSQWLSKLRVT